MSPSWFVSVVSRGRMVGVSLLIQLHVTVQVTACTTQPDPLWREYFAGEMVPLLKWRADTSHSETAPSARYVPFVDVAVKMTRHVPRRDVAVLV